MCIRDRKESHGSGPVARHGGSIGSCSDPSRVYPGKKMAGHLGSERVTVQNLQDVYKRQVFTPGILLADLISFWSTEGSTIRAFFSAPRALSTI